MESEGDFKMKKFIPFIIMVMVVLGVLVGVYFVQKSMDESGPPSIMFSATDRNGTHYSESVFSENKITMINLWEPWCGPCVSEMPGIQRLYSTYKDKGLMVIGVYTTDNMEFQVSQVLRDAGVTYPVILDDTSFSRFRTGSVPTTFFVDSKGQVIDMKKSTSRSGQPVVVGSRSYEDWEAMIKPYL